MAKLDQETQEVIELLGRHGINEQYQSLEEVMTDLNAGKMVAEVGGRGHVLFLKPRTGVDYRTMDTPMSDPQNPMIDMEARIWASYSGANFDHFEFNDKNRREYWSCDPVILFDRGRYFAEDSGVVYMKVEPTQVKSFSNGRIS